MIKIPANRFSGVLGAVDEGATVAAFGKKFLFKRLETAHPARWIAEAMNSGPEE
jgi:hypothetical protein